MLWYNIYPFAISIILALVQLKLKIFLISPTDRQFYCHNPLILTSKSNDSLIKWCQMWFLRLLQGKSRKWSKISLFKAFCHPSTIKLISATFVNYIQDYFHWNIFPVSWTVSFRCNSRTYLMCSTQYCWNLLSKSIGGILIMVYQQSQQQQQQQQKH